MTEFESGKTDGKKSQDDPLAASLGDLVNYCEQTGTKRFGRYGKGWNGNR